MAVIDAFGMPPRFARRVCNREVSKSDDVDPDDRPEVRRSRKLGLRELCSAEMMCGHVSVSCGVADEAILVVQSVEDRRRDHMTISGEAMPRGLWRDQRR
jgi:hypothetical protein